MIAIRTILIISFFVFQNCGGSSKNEDFLARVGQSTLLNKDIPRSSEENLSKTSALVGQWVAEEILFIDTKRVVSLELNILQTK